jgi:hypothetical protein
VCLGVIFCGRCVGSAAQCTVLCVWRARGGVRAVMFAQCAVVAAVRDVVRACGACVFVCCVRVCDVRCVACLRALFRVTRAMTLMCRSAGWGLSRRVCLCARVCGVMVAGSAVLVSMCAVVRVGPAKCEASWLRHRRDVRCACWACIAGAVSSVVSRVLYRSRAIADVCRRVCVAAPRLAVAGA